MSDAYGEILAPLLIEPDGLIFEQSLGALIAAPSGGVVVCASLVDLLLSWPIHRRRPSPATIDRVLGCLYRHQALLPHAAGHQRLCGHLLVQVFGCDEASIEITEPDGPAASWPAGDYWLASRCVAAGVPAYAGSLSSVAVARDCCWLLNRCRYVEALRALGCLTWLRHQPGDTELDRPIALFIDQAETYLAGIVELYPSPSLQWECLLLTSDGRAAPGGSPNGRGPG